MVITSVGDEITFISVGDEIGDLQKKHMMLHGIQMIEYDGIFPKI